MKVLAIHGAWSSSISFNYLKYRTKSRNWFCQDYDHRVDSWEDIVIKSKAIMNEPYIAIGHSLGGLVALHHTNEKLCKGIVTLASPLTGLDLNLVQLYLSRGTLISKIAKNSKAITEIQKFEYNVPVMHLIANKGFNPFIYESNDGVLPLQVQTGWSCGDLFEIAANHYEILQSDATLNAVGSFIDRF